MREILFRGQTRRKGEYCINMRYDKYDSNWVYGGIFPQNGGGDRAIIYQQEPTVEKRIVYADTVGQYTGLTDKNGKKIFEGDIVEFYFFDKTRRNGKLVEIKNTKTMLIEWASTSFYMTELFRNFWYNKEIGVITEKIFTYRGYKKQGVYESDSCYFVEVIGNIYDNPELLEVK